MLKEGTKKYSSQEIAEKIDFYGAHFETSAGNDIATVSLYTLNKYLEEVMGVVDTVISENLNYYLEEHPKESKIIVNKVILAATARHAARKARELVQRKNVLTGSRYFFQ